MEGVIHLIQTLDTDTQVDGGSDTPDTNTHLIHTGDTDTQVDGGSDTPDTDTDTQIHR